MVHRPRICFYFFYVETLHGKSLVLVISELGFYWGKLWGIIAIIPIELNFVNDIKSGVTIKKV